ncbi:MAG TPA: START-like domain-containing protein [Draconibacterium sp.]|nr:START-like domain-containing protein [Draconibacterium sp.]
MAKNKVQFEYVINCSPKVLYNRLSTASGLTEWFADDVRVRGKKYTFIWDDSEQVAEMTLQKENRLVRFNWLHEDEESYFEFRITRDELTGDVSLLITDFVEEGEEDESKGLWDTQIADLKHVLGSVA